MKKNRLSPYTERIILFVVISFTLHVLFLSAAVVTVQTLASILKYFGIEWKIDEKVMVPEDDLQRLIEIAQRRLVELPELSFVETTPDQAVKEKPAHAHYYSAHSSVASQTQPSPDEKNHPKLDGSQEHEMKTETVIQPVPEPLRPTPLPPPEIAETKPEEPQQKELEVAKPREKESPQKPVEPEKFDDTKIVIARAEALLEKLKTQKLTSEEPKPLSPQQLAKIDRLEKPKEQKTSSRETQNKPSTRKPSKTQELVEDDKPRSIKSNASKQKIPGATARTNGGTTQRGKIASVDAVASPFGSYDLKIIEEVKQRWYSLVSAQHSGERVGTVTVQFRLIDTGRIEDLRIADNTAGAILGLYCEKSVRDSAPFDPWPKELRTLQGKNWREVTFTFYY